MAGKHRSEKAAEYDARHDLRLPGELKERLARSAERHKRSLNEEIVVRLDRQRWRRQVRKALLEMEPQPDDPRTDQEIAAEIEWLRGSSRW